VTEPRPFPRLLKLAAFVLLASFATFAACSSSNTAVPPGVFFPLGNWGGDSAAMIVSDTAMHLHIACTYGDVSGRLPAAGDGSFEVAGSYTLHAFPIAVGPPMPARFVGRLTRSAASSTATITVTVTDTIAHTTVVRGPVTVTLGQDPKLMPCPVCRRPIVTRRGILGALRF
jgi:hypothetical protein